MHDSSAKMQMPSSTLQDHVITLLTCTRENSGKQGLNIGCPKLANQKARCNQDQDLGQRTKKCHTCCHMHDSLTCKVL